MALTEDALADRVRSVCAGKGYVEAVGLDFSRQPTASFESGAFTVGLTGQTPVGGMSFTEEARATVLVSVIRPLNNDYQTSRRLALQDGRSLLSAIVRDGAVTSGEYTVDDGGRSLAVDAPKGANYLLLRLSLPVNFEALFAS